MVKKKISIFAISFSYQQFDLIFLFVHIKTGVKFQIHVMQILIDFLPNSNEEGIKTFVEKIN